MTALYRIQIIDHYKHPRNFKLLLQPTVKQSVVNRYCGDELTITLKVDNDTVSEVGFTGQGCALSIASASLLLEAIKGKKLTEILDWKEEDQLSLVGIPKESGRKKCVLLPYQALKQSLAQIITKE